MSKAETANLPSVVNAEGKPASSILIVAFASTALIVMAAWIAFLVWMAFLVIF